MRLVSVWALSALWAAAMSGQTSPPPSFEARDVRPHGASEPHPLLPGMRVWIFGLDLGPSPGCATENTSDPRTYRPELCGVRVLAGGLTAQLIFVSPRQINLVLPSHPWQNEDIEIQVIREGVSSAAVPVHVGEDRPIVSLAEPAYAGMPLWLRVEMPWGVGRLRYPFHTEPWDLGPGWVEMRFEGRELPPLPLPTVGPMPDMGSVALLEEPTERQLDRIPLHLLYPLHQPGRYEVRYVELLWKKRKSEWTEIEIKPSTAAQRTDWFEELTQGPPEDVASLVADYLPNVLARRDAAALLALGPYLDHPNPVVRRYAGYGLYYFDVELRKRVLPGKGPPRGFVR